MKKIAALTAVLATAGVAYGVGDQVTIDISGIESWDTAGDPSNTTLNFDVASALGLAPGTAVTVNGVGWDVTIATVGASWQSEAAIGLGDLAGDNDVVIRPGIDSGEPGTGTFTSDGTLKFADAGIPDLELVDGVIGLEFFETFDDVGDAVDANFLSGSTLTIQVVPAPGAFALLGLAGIAARRRRRG